MGLSAVAKRLAAESDCNRRPIRERKSGASRRSRAHAAKHHWFVVRILNLQPRRSRSKGGVEAVALKVKSPPAKGLS